MGEFRMPSLGADMDRGTIVEWRVAPGDTVHKGDIVAVVDTDKSDIEVEVFEDGVIDELVIPEGEEVPVGTVLARLRPFGASAAMPPPPSPAPAATGGTAPVVSPLVRHLAENGGVDLAAVHGTGPGGAIHRPDVEAAIASDAATPATAPPRPRPRPTGDPAWVRSSPRARRRAAELGIELASVRGTGPDGAVRTGDVETARAAVPAEPATPATAGAASGRRADRSASMRAATARLMARSKREIPHYYLDTAIDLGPALAWMHQVNEDRPVTERLLPAALLLKATARAAKAVPDLNGFWIDDAFQRADAVDLGVAVSLRGGGMIAPTLHQADARSVDDIMVELRDLVGRARAGVLRGADMAPPSLTVTNLGDQGVDAVYGVIYPPQVALVGFGRIREQPWASEGMLTVRPVVKATLAADHRASDGHRGAVLLSTIERLLADPENL